MFERIVAFFENVNLEKQTEQTKLNFKAYANSDAGKDHKGLPG